MDAPGHIASPSAASSRFGCGPARARGTLSRRFSNRTPTPEEGTLPNPSAPAAATPGAPATLPRPLFLALLGLVVLLSYGRPTLQPYSFAWEDKASIQEDKGVMDGRIGQVASDAFRGVRSPEDRSGAYRPLTRVSYALNARLTGPGPRGFHLVNLLLHLACAVLVFFLARAVLLDEAAAIVAALLFAAHPMLAGAVAWVSGRAELLLGLFGLGALMVHLGGRAGHKGRVAGWRLLAAPALAFLAMLSQEGGLSLVAVAPLLDAATPGRPRGAGEWARRNAGYWVAAALYLILRAQAHPYQVNTFVTPRAVLALSLGQLLFFEVATAVLPALSLIYTPVRLAGPQGTDLIRRADDPLVTIGVVVVLLLAAASIWVYRRNRSAGAGLAWFWIALLLPFVSLTLTLHTVADRALYFPVAGLSLALGALALALWRRRPGLMRPIEVVVAVLIFLHMVMASARAGLWRDEITYLQSVAAHHPRDAHAWDDLGVAHSRLGAQGEALAAFRRAHQADAQDATAARNLGKLYIQTEQYDSAMAVLVPAARANPGRLDLRLDLADALVGKGNYSQAFFQYNFVLETDSNNVTAMVGAGKLFAMQNDMAAATRALERAHQLDPLDPAIANNLGLVYQARDMIPQAEAAFREALRADPKVPQFHYNLARLQYVRGDYEGALEQVNQLIAMMPGNPGPRTLRDTLYARIAARGRAGGRSGAR